MKMKVLSGIAVIMAMLSPIFFVMGKKPPASIGGHRSTPVEVWSLQGKCIDSVVEAPGGCPSPDAAITAIWHGPTTWSSNTTLFLCACPGSRTATYWQ